VKFLNKIQRVLWEWHIRYSIYSMNRQIDRVEQALIQELKERGDIKK